MKEQLVSFETAMLAKEKGFADLVGVYRGKHYYNHLGELDGNVLDDIKESLRLQKTLNITLEESVKLNKFAPIAAPTQSLLQKWLREVHGIHIQVYVMEKWVDGNNMIIWFEVNLKTTNYLHGLSNVKCNMLEFNSYELALEQGLREALELIYTHK